MEKLLEIKQLRDNLYLLDENHESTGYLLIGSEKACLIDTMNGYSDLAAEVKALTDKPVIVINTHGHPDHIFGNPYFEKAYIHPNDEARALEFAAIPEYVEKLKKRGLTFPPFEYVNDGDEIDLGDISLKVILLPGHTKGGILLLCPGMRILFTGDSINHHLWMQIPGCLSVADMIVNLEKLLYLENEADLILHGHAHDFDDISLISALLQGAKEIVAGQTQKDTPYKWFDGVGLYHPFEVPADKKFQQEDHGICYDPNNVK